MPHFEKMLYDNAQLARAFLFAYQVTHSAQYRETLERLFNWIECELTDPAGGFYTGLDADSEGEEGRFYVFESNELQDALPKEEAEAASLYYDIRPEGNWEGRNVLWAPRSAIEVATELGIDEATLRDRLLSATLRLFKLRATRSRPLTDDKIVAGLTGLTVSAFAEAGRILDNHHYVEVAEKAARFVLGTMLRDDGRLWRAARLGTVGQVAMLDDYAYMAEGLLALYETTGRSTHIHSAERLIQQLITDFFDEETQRVYQSPLKHEPLLLRMAEAHDGPLPNATAVAADVLVRLSYHLDRREWREKALTLVQAHGLAAQRFPRGHTDLLRVARAIAEPRTIIVMVPGKNSQTTESLRRACMKRALPGHVLAILPQQPSSDDLALPLFQGRTATTEEPHVYVCHDNTCEVPVQTVKDFENHLQLPLVRQIRPA